MARLTKFHHQHIVTSECMHGDANKKNHGVGPTRSRVMGPIDEQCRWRDYIFVFLFYLKMGRGLNRTYKMHR
jgi:hypothetical protein